MSEKIAYDKNSEILFIYGAKLCNPNGDPDEENRPRIDSVTYRNLVSDVRLKRFFRNYIIDRLGEEYIWVSTVGRRHVRADERLESLKIKQAEEVTKKCIDARLFGATIPIGGEGRARGESIAITGPVQFTWGFSLHPVELVESSTITSVFTGREPQAERAYGTIGKDWRLYYSLIAFYGVVNGLRAQHTGLRELDVKILDLLLWNALALDATTRSKVGEKPYLYLRVEYKDRETLLGDLRDYLECEPREHVRELEDVTLDFTNLVSRLQEYGERINKIFVYEGDKLKTKDSSSLSETLENVQQIKDKLVRLPKGIEQEVTLEKILEKPDRFLRLE